MTDFASITDFIRSLYPEKDFVGLHEPRFMGNEKKYLIDCIDSTYVSYVGKYVGRFEEMTAAYVGVKHAVAVVNGTCALQIALQLKGVGENDEVLTQAVTFVATVNAIAHTRAVPVFIDSEKEHLGMSPAALEHFLENETVKHRDGFRYNKTSKRRIAACVPVHIFGHPARITEILEICNNYGILLIEDSAESLGSKYRDRPMGTFGEMGILSYNGNKTITTGGGGMIITNDPELAKRAKHITTTAKIPHPYEFFHDETGYNYRLTNLNAAIGCAQMEQIDGFIRNKRELAEIYAGFFATMGIEFFTEKKDCYSNYWLNVIFLKDREERDAFLKYTNEHQVMTRPAWTMMNKLPMYKHCQSTDLSAAQWLEDHLVNIPSSVRIS